MSTLRWLRTGDLVIRSPLARSSSATKTASLRKARFPASSCKTTRRHAQDRDIKNCFGVPLFVNATCIVTGVLRFIFPTPSIAPCSAISVDMTASSVPSMQRLVENAENFSSDNLSEQVVEAGLLIVLIMFLCCASFINSIEVSLFLSCAELRPRYLSIYKVFVQ